MKLVSLAVLGLCACVYAAASNEYVDSITSELGAQELHLKAGGDATFSEDDHLLSTAVQALERVHGRSLVADAIQNVLEGFRDVVINGNDALPPLDPLVIPLIGPFTYTTLGFRATGSITNFNMEGLRWYIINHVNFNALRLTFGIQMTVPWITFTGTYDTTAFFALISHRAGGNYRIFINRLEVSVDTRLGTNILGGGHLILRDLDIKIVIHDINIQINGMVGSNLLNNAINAFVQSAAQNLLANELDTISQMLSEQLFDTINDFLREFTLEDLLGLSGTVNK